ncbi:DUF6090 family protein [Psychroserpens sp.]
MENKTSKYLKYAVGEILLVVIGILLALQINNWNEHRKQINTQNAIYRIIKEDLLNDISEFNDFIASFEVIRKPAFDAVLTTKLTTKDWEENSNYVTVMSGYKDIAMSQRGLGLLKNLSSLSNNLEQNLTSRINTFYNLHIVELNVGERDLRESFSDNYNHFQNYDWFSAFLLNRRNKMSDGLIQEISNNQVFKNRLTLYYLTFDIYTQELKNFKTDAEILVVEIDNFLKEKQ